MASRRHDEVLSTSGGRLAAGVPASGAAGDVIWFRVLSREWVGVSSNREF
jgi:hypothetical protein